SLDYYPRRANILLELLQNVGPDDPRDDLGRRFLLIDNPAGNFERLAGDRAAATDWLAVSELSGAMLTLEPDHALANYQMARAKIHRYRAEQAMVHVKKVAVANIDANLRRGYLDFIIRELGNMQMSWVAYDIATDKAEAFRRGGIELVTTR